MLLFGAALSLAAVMTLPVSGKEMWLSPRVGQRGTNDFLRLFQDDAGWPIVQKHVSYFEFNGNPKDFEADELRHIFDYLRRKNIGLVYGLLAVSGDGTCGFGVEGYSSRGDPLRIVRQLHALGADIRYFAMDEPLWFGHNYRGPNACHASIDDIAADVARKVADLRTVFPAAQFGDIEPVGVPNENWLTDLKQWLIAFRVHTGQDLAFVRADIQWASAWQPQMRELERLLHKEGIPLQVIYNGDGDTDAEWAVTAARRYATYEKGAIWPPSAAVFMSWAPHPSRLLPETDGDTLTGIALRYIKR